jgi:hypothetical protein
MKANYIETRIIHILKVCAKHESPYLIYKVTDAELLSTFNTLRNICLRNNINHNGILLFEAVIRKLTLDKFYPELFENTMQNSVIWISDKINTQC